MLEFDLTRKEDAKKRKTNLYDINKEFFSNPDILEVLEEYIACRKEQKNLPARTAWKKQLEYLKAKGNDMAIINQVNMAIVKGWRAVAYPPNEPTNAVQKKKVGELSNDKF